MRAERENRLKKNKIEHLETKKLQI